MSWYQRTLMCSCILERLSVLTCGSLNRMRIIEPNMVMSRDVAYFLNSCASWIYAFWNDFQPCAFYNRTFHNHWPPVLRPICPAIRFAIYQIAEAHSHYTWQIAVKTIVFYHLLFSQNLIQQFEKKMYYCYRRHIFFLFLSTLLLHTFTSSNKYGKCNTVFIFYI